MRTPHFFKAYCRLGLTKVPLGTSEKNIGVEDAPDAVVTADFLSNFPAFKVSQYRFPKPEDIKSEDYWQVLAAQLSEFKEQITKNLNGGVSIVVGGDNSVTFSSLLNILEKTKPSEVAYIQFDSHGEANTFAGSISKNFHGMYLRPFLDGFDVSQINQLVSTKLPAENILTIGNLDLDLDEEEIYKKLKIRNFNSSNINKAADFIKNFIQKFEHIHINFDIDVFDKSFTPATGIPARNGLFPKDIFPLLEIIKNHPRWSLDLVEVNPKKMGAEKTIKLAQEILEFMLK